MTWVFKHYQDVSSNVGKLQATDSNTCGHYALFFLFARARGKSMESFIQPFKYLRDIDNDHKIGETLRKLVTDNLRFAKGLATFPALLLNFFRSPQACSFAPPLFRSLARSSPGKGKESAATQPTNTVKKMIQFCKHNLDFSLLD